MKGDIPCEGRALHLWLQGVEESCGEYMKTDRSIIWKLLRYGRLAYDQR
jgi:hypothetical protein